MHRLFAELIEEPQGHQIQIAVDKTVETELTGTELTFAMLYHFLADLGKTGVLRQVRDIPVHLGEDLNILHHLLAVRFQAAVHIVQGNAGNTTCRSIEELGRQVLGQFVIKTFLLPTAHQIKSVFGDHPIELRDLIRTVLQVSIHGDNHIALRCLETAVQRRTLTIVATETNPPHNAFF